MELTRARELIKAQQHTAEKQHQLLEVQKKMLARTRLALGMVGTLLMVAVVIIVLAHKLMSVYDSVHPPQPPDVYRG
jgi:hypothetical protein